MIYPGTLFNNRFLVRRKLGNGGFAHTFEVSDRRVKFTRGKPAVKLLKVLKIPPSVDEGYRKAIALFQREAEVLSHLNHPGIPQVEPDGYFTVERENCSEPFHCLVMEKIPGENLEQWLANHSPITAQQAINWLKQLLDILQRLHQQQYFHRDIKPSNIMLKPDGQLVLIDFGGVRQVTHSYLAKISGDREITGLISPGYTPLEQAYGKAVPQSDFFALGNTLVHLLTGKHPLDLETDAIAGQLLWHNCVPQSSRNTLENFASLGNLLDRMMAPFPANRPQTVAEILSELDTIVNPQSLGEIHSNPSDKLRRKTLMGVGMSLVGLLAIATVTTAAELTSPNIALACNNSGVNHHVSGRELLAELSYNCAVLLNPNYAKARYNRAVLYENQGKLELAAAEYDKAIAVGGLSAPYNNRARLYIKEAQYNKAIDLLEEGLQLASSDRVQYAFLKNLGWLQLKRGNSEAAKVQLQRAISLIPNRAPAYCVLAQVWDAEENFSAANRAGKNCLKYDPNATVSREAQEWIDVVP